MLTAFAAGRGSALGIVLEVPATDLPAFSTGRRCATRVFGEISFTTSMLGHVASLLVRFIERCMRFHILGKTPERNVPLILSPRRLNAINFSMVSEDVARFIVWTANC